MGKESKDEDSKPSVAKSAVELQRFKLEKLMKNPDKPVVIPERVKEKKTPHVPEFVRNVMGSSAGAGSGEFHVYRHLRRKEYARQKFIQEKSEKELLEEAYHQKVLDNKQAAEEKTAKKRAKRLKKKGKKKFKKCDSKGSLNNQNDTSKNESSLDDESECESGEDRKSSDTIKLLEVPKDSSESVAEKNIDSETNNSSLEKGQTEN